MHLISPSKRRDIVWELVTASYGPLPKIQNAFLGLYILLTQPEIRPNFDSFHTFSPSEFYLKSETKIESDLRLC